MRVVYIGLHHATLSLGMPAGIPNTHESPGTDFACDASVNFQQNSSRQRICRCECPVTSTGAGWKSTTSDTTFGTTSRDLAGKYPIHSIQRPHNRTHHALPSWDASCALMLINSIDLNAQHTGSVKCMLVQVASIKPQQRFTLFNSSPVQLQQQYCAPGTSSLPLQQSARAKSACYELLYSLA